MVHAAALLVLAAPAPAHADAASCIGMPDGPDRTICLVKASCEAVKDGTQRADCMAAAEDLARSLKPPEVDTVPRPPEIETVVISKEPVAPTVPVAPQPPVVLEEAPKTPTTSVATRADDDGITRTTVNRDVFDFPAVFEGAVTALRRMPNDSQLIAVNDEMLFQGDVARSSAIDIGDTVTVERLSTRFKSERFRITGPSKRSVMARRIVCEAVDLPKSTRRKCALIE